MPGVFNAPSKTADLICAEGSFKSKIKGIGLTEPFNIAGKNSSSRKEKDEPKFINGFKTLCIGLIDKDVSPVNKVVMGWEEDKPIINLAEVPEFPKSKAVFGSANPPKPIPLIKQFDEFDKLIENFKNKKLSEEFDKAAEDIRLATKHLGIIVGKVDVEEILGSIFNDFCIGK